MLWGRHPHHSARLLPRWAEGPCAAQQQLGTTALVEACSPAPSTPSSLSRGGAPTRLLHNSQYATMTAPTGATTTAHTLPATSR